MIFHATNIQHSSCSVLHTSVTLVFHIRNSNLSDTLTHAQIASTMTAKLSMVTSTAKRALNDDTCDSGAQPLSTNHDSISTAIDSFKIQDEDLDCWDLGSDDLGSLLPISTVVEDEDLDSWDVGSDMSDSFGPILQETGPQRSDAWDLGSDSLDSYGPIPSCADVTEIEVDDGGAYSEE